MIVCSSVSCVDLQACVIGSAREMRRTCPSQFSRLGLSASADGPRKMRGGEAPEGATSLSPPPPFRASAGAPSANKPAQFAQTRKRWRGASPSSAPPRLFCPRGRASGRRRGPCGPQIRQAFARLRPRRVQPSKAVPLSRDGRLPEASRCRGYEPRQQAPHPPRVLQRPAGRPSRGEGEM
jgi:hypothetical protein